MSKVTSKLQVTIPKAIADRYRIAPGDEVEWVEAGEVIRVIPAGRTASQPTSVEERLRLFDAATRRQRARERERRGPVAGKDRGRGWTREELYGRGRAR